MNVSYNFSTLRISVPFRTLTIYYVSGDSANLIIKIVIIHCLEEITSYKSLPYYLVKKS